MLYFVQKPLTVPAGGNATAILCEEDWETLKGLWVDRLRAGQEDLLLASPVPMHAIVDADMFGDTLPSETSDK